MDDVTKINGVTLLNEMGEVLSNMHIILARQYLEKLDKEKLHKEMKLLTCKGALISKVLGACQCTLTIPVASLVKLTRSSALSWYFACMVM